MFCSSLCAEVTRPDPPIYLSHPSLTLSMFVRVLRGLDFAKVHTGVFFLALSTVTVTVTRCLTVSTSEVAEPSRSMRACTNALAQA